jgi:thiosulfate/3-mercaptopyruvate sulfurtransferase
LPSITLPGLLVEPDWLEAHLGHDRLRIVDLRDRAGYAKGHLPGAVQVELKDLGYSKAGLDNVLLPAEEFEARMVQCGISPGDSVVAYDDNCGLPASRLVWALHRYGHAAAAVLDGGWDLWQEDLKPVDKGAATVSSTTYSAGAETQVIADHDWLMAHMQQDNVILLDTRSRSEFDQGHVPGAVSWDWFRAVPEDSWRTSRGRDELVTELARIGVTESSEVVTYCATGMRAAHTYVVLRQAGFPRVRLYDGSWQDWSARSGSDDR